MTYPAQPNPHQPPGTPGPPPQAGYPPPAHGPQPVPYLPPQQVYTTASTGLPAWMHVLYAIGGIPTCGILWIVWGVHWWFVQSKTKTNTTTQASTYQRPTAPGHPYQQR